MALLQRRVWGGLHEGVVGGDRGVGRHQGRGGTCQRVDVARGAGGGVEGRLLGVVGRSAMLGGYTISFLFTAGFGMRASGVGLVGGGGPVEGKEPG